VPRKKFAFGRRKKATDSSSSTAPDATDAAASETTAAATPAHAQAASTIAATHSFVGKSNDTLLVLPDQLKGPSHRRRGAQ
jgi:hypothetical protein